MKYKVFIVIDNLGRGGAQRQVVEYLKFADRQRFDFSVINLTKDYDSVREEIEKLRVRVIGIQHKGFFNRGTLSKLAQLFQEERPDIVYTFLFTSDTYGRLAAKMAGIRVIICAIRSVDQWKKWHHILVDRIFARFTNKITINAENIRPYLVNVEKLNPDKIITIYNGIDLKRFEGFSPSGVVRRELNIPADALVVGMVGHFSERKDYKTFFEAAKIVVEKMPDVHFVAVGDGPLLASFKVSTSQSSKLEDKVIFTGHRKDALDLMNIFDIGVLSSPGEGCPNVILEYMACSKPVVASDVGGCAELVIEGKTGFIVPKANPQALAEKLIRLLQDKDLRMRMGQEGRHRVEENFTSDVMARKTEQLFTDLLNVNGR